MDRAWSRVRVDEPQVPVPRLHRGVVERVRAHEHADSFATQRVGGDKGVLESMPRSLEGDAEHRIEVAGLARRNAEEAVVEACRVLEQRRSPDRGAPRRSGARIIVGVCEVVRGKRPHAILGTNEEFPEFIAVTDLR